MPFFTFSVNDQVRYRTRVHSVRCTEHTKTGAQCKRRCVIGSPYCSTHLSYIHHLKIMQSNIPNGGKGLFAIDPRTVDRDVIFEKGDRITEYHGELINLQTLNERYGEDLTAPYAVGISADSYEDGARVRGIGSLANTSPGHNNATLSIYRGRASLKATKNIRNGDEVYLSYGRRYRLNEPDVQYATTAR